MPKIARAPVGAPKKDNPLSQRHLVRMTVQDEADALADMERLSLVTGVEWDWSMYIRMCMKQMSGKHLA